MDALITAAGETDLGGKPALPRSLIITLVVEHYPAEGECNYKLPWHPNLSDPRSGVSKALN